MSHLLTGASRIFYGAMLGFWASAATAQNLITNGGFETGNFSGWTQSGNTGFTGVDGGSANSGSFGASFGPVGSLGAIADPLDERADHEGDADADQPERGDRTDRPGEGEDRQSGHGHRQADGQDDEAGRPEPPAHSTGVVGAVDPSGATTTAVP